MRHLIHIITAAAMIIMLSGCGQKGPLYLPDEPERSSNERLEGYYKRY